ncbi:MAG: DUF3810 domain-containing protein [Clostridia bacterium]|nr:DUF3810 domain-containing protein [Clostridia bacterium]
MIRDYKRPFSERHRVLNVILMILFPIVMAGMIAAVYFVPNSPLYTRSVANYYSVHIFPKIAYLGNCFSNIFMFSITELLAVVGTIAGVVIVVCFFVCLVRSIIKKRFLKFLYRTLCVVLAAVLLIYGSFQLMHGLNYKRDTSARRLGLETKEREIGDLYAVEMWAYQGAIAARSQLGEDYNGVSHMMTSFPESVFHANMLINAVDDKFDFGLSDTFIRSKPVMLSSYWSYTNIVGLYDPVLGESNINVDYTCTYDLPITICHEMIHAKGYAKEGDANFISVICCIMSDRADFRYAGYFWIFTSIANILDNYDQFAYDPNFRMLIKDINASDKYWESKEMTKLARKVGEVSEATNNTYLEANGQEGGTETYTVDSNIYVEFFYKYIMPEINQ